MLDADFVDLFAGAGLATRGLVQAGWKPAGAIDNWRPAAATWQANFTGGECRTIEAVAPDATQWRQAALVWMTLPRIWSSGRYGAGDVPASTLLRIWGEAASSYRPIWVVCEYESTFTPSDAVHHLQDGLGWHYTLSDHPYLCPHRNLGGAVRRERRYAVFTLRGHVTPLVRFAPAPGPRRTARDVGDINVVDITLPVTPVEEQGVLKPHVRRLVEYALERRGGVVTLRDDRDVASFHEPHPQVPARQNHMIYAYAGGWRWPTVAEWRRALGVPDEHVLMGNETTQMRMLGEGTDVRMAQAIGQSVMEAARQSGLFRIEGAKP